MQASAGARPNTRRGPVWSAWIAFTDWFIGQAPYRADPDALRRARLSVMASLNCAVGCGIGVFLRWDAPQISWIFAIAIPPCLLAPFALRWTGSITLAGNVLTAALFISFAAMNFATGGTALTALYSFPFLPMIAVVLAGRSSGYVWTALASLHLMALWKLLDTGWPPPYPVDTAAENVVQFRAITVLTVVAMSVILCYEWLKEEALRMLSDAVAREREVRRQLVQQEKLASVGQLAAGVAHEINNPLAFIRSNLHQLRQRLGTMPAGGDAEEQAESVEMLEETLSGVERIETITAALGRFMRSDDPARHEDVDLCEVIQDALSIVRPHTTGVAEVRCEPATAAAHIRGRRGEIEQVLINLLMNAADSIDDGGVIRVSVSPCPNGFEIGVEDDGSGIEPDVLDRVFDPFFTTKDVGKGTGLGLAVSDQIVRDHGGEIRVRSRLGAGSRFVVFLPSRDGA